MIGFERSGLVGGLLLAGFFLWQAVAPSALSRPNIDSNRVSDPARIHATKPIEQIRVADRVVTELLDEARQADRLQSLGHKLPRTRSNRVDSNVARRVGDASAYPTTSVDPATWRLVRMRAEITWDDGTIDDINVETLQHSDWIAYHQVEVGESVPIPLDLVEMGLPKTLMAKVLAIERCPPIKHGPGRIVLTTVNHLNNYILDLTIADEAGHAETIGVTAFHKFYSATRNQWISAEELSRGESLDGLGRILRVIAIQRRHNSDRVYNIMVDGDHVYRVTALAALVHNVCRNVSSGYVDEARVLDHAIDYLGPGYREIDTDVFRSADNLRQFRYTDADLLDTAPHVHFEAVAANGRDFLENGHVYITPTNLNNPTPAPAPLPPTP